MENFQENPKDIEFPKEEIILAMKAKNPTEEQEQILIQFANAAIEFVQDGECACFTFGGYFLTNDLDEADFGKDDCIYFVENTSQIVLKYKRVIYSKTVTRFR